MSPKGPSSCLQVFVNQGSPLRFGRFYITNDPPLGFARFCHPKFPPWVWKILCHQGFSLGFFRFVTQGSLLEFGRFYIIKGLSLGCRRFFITKGPSLGFGGFCHPKVCPWVYRFLSPKGLPFVHNTALLSFISLLIYCLLSSIPSAYNNTELSFYSLRDGDHKEVWFRFFSTPPIPWKCVAMVIAISWLLQIPCVFSVLSLPHQSLNKAEIV